jgi:hypothetical protein
MGAVIMDLQGWIKFYEKKTGEKFIRKDDFALLFFPDKGFAEIGVSTSLQTILVHRVCGDLRAWRMVIESFMQFAGYHKMTAIVIRHMKPFIRLWGAKITNEYEAGYGPVYEIEFSNGKGKCYPVSKIGGEPQYLVMLEVK